MQNVPGIILNRWFQAHYSCARRAQHMGQPTKMVLYCVFAQQGALLAYRLFAKSHFQKIFQISPRGACEKCSACDTV